MPDAVRVGNDCLPDNPSVGFADTSLYTREVSAAAAGSGRPMVAPTFIDGSAMEIVETGGQSRPPLHSKTMVRCRITRVGL